MKGYSSWGKCPYIRLNDNTTAKSPFVSRVAPFAEGFTIDWFEPENTAGDHQLLYRPRGTEDWTILSAENGRVQVTGLPLYAEFEAKIRNVATGRESTLRLIKTSDYPGVVLDYMHSEDASGDYTGRSRMSSPIVRLPSGGLLAAGDTFDTTTDWPTDSIGAKLFRSDDEGKTWRYLCELVPAYWVSPFVHRGKLYAISAGGEYGSVLIARSEDEGLTWTAPVTLFYGEGRRGMGWLLGGGSVLEHKGRLYFAGEYGCEPHYRTEPDEKTKAARHTPFFQWRDVHVCTDFASAILSVDVDADLLDASSWHCTGFYYPDPAICWCIEGEIFPHPDGDIRYIARTNAPNKALVLKLDNGDFDAPPVLDRMVDIQFYGSEFDIRYDDVSGKYIAVGNELGGEVGMVGRTVLSMIVSDDAEHWRLAKRILDCRDTADRWDSFSQPYFLIDGEDLLLSVRTSWCGVDWHDTNAVTIQRLENFRQYL